MIGQIIVADLLKQMSLVIPTIITSTMTLTAIIHGMFDIKNDNVNHALSWCLAILCAELFVLCNGLTFGLGNWDYAVAAICGLLTGACANGVYDWPAVKRVFDSLTELFRLRY